MAQNHFPELVFITIAEMGHILPTMALAKKLIARSANQLSVLILILGSPYQDETVNSHVQSLVKSHQTITSSSSQNSLFLLELPTPTQQDNLGCPNSMESDNFTPIVKQTLLERYHAPASQEEQGQRRQLSSLVVDFFCTSMMDVGDDLGVPSYISCTFSASFLSLGFLLHSLYMDDVSEEVGGKSVEETVVEVAGITNPVPMKVWPQLFLTKESVTKRWFGENGRIRQAKGILVNTFMELDTSILQALRSLSDVRRDDYGHIPLIYPIGPVLDTDDDDHNNSTHDNHHIIMRWLDTQPPSSVVFLCFGSRGCLHTDQVREIATALERSGQRFIWSLRLVVQDVEFSEVLPEGFLDRTARIGKVTGWAPQKAVLGHKAVGAFMTHCGWNSILESLWYGVPMLTLPMYAEHQLNAFVLVKELGLAVDIRMDYRYHVLNRTSNMVVGGEDVEKGIRTMMEEEEGRRVRHRVKDVSEKGRKAHLEAGRGGSSFQWMGRFIDDVLGTFS